MNSSNEDVSTVLNEPQLLGRVGGDRMLLREVAGLFISEAPKILSEIRDAVSRGDAAEIFQVAHKLKGSVANFSAPAAVEAAASLERIGRRGQLEGAEQALSRLEREIGRVRRALLDLIARD